TNIGDGISDSNSQFEGNGRSNATWVMILLSDGKANRPIDEEYAREYALNKSQTAQAMGVWIYTIGLGAEDDIDEELLKEIQTDGYFYAPSATDLDDIYQTIAEDLIYEVKYDVISIQITLMKP
ncbi:MAG: VWA domain-containing protein, partial [Candidatus Bathyarchaeia archaeon]